MPRPNIPRLKRFALFLLTTLLAAGIATAQPPQAVPPPRLQQAPQVGSALPFAMGHADAKILVGIDLKALRESRAGRFLSSQMGSLSSQLPQQAAPMAMFLPLAMQALSDIDTVLISSPGNFSDNATGVRGKDTAQFLVVLDGRFASSPINLLMNGRAEDYHGAKIYAAGGPSGVAPGPARANDIRFTLLNNNRIVAGDAKSVHAALDQVGAAGVSGGIPAALRARATDLSREHDFWVVVQEPLSNLQSGNSQTSPQAGAMMAGLATRIEGLEMGFALRDGMLFDLNLLAKDENTARLMAQAFAAGLQSGLASKQMSAEQAALLAKKVHVSAEGNRLNFSIQLTEEELEQQIRSAQPPRALASAAPNTRPFTGTAQQPAQVRKVKIYGLDDGPREIEIKR